MVETAPARARLIRTYAALVGVPAIALFAILRVGESIAPSTGARAIPDPGTVTQPGPVGDVPLLLA
jgi:hypothetical protein